MAGRQTDRAHRVVIVGAGFGGLFATRALRRAPVEITRLVRRSLRIVGSYGARVRTDMPVLLGLIESGVLNPAGSVTRRFPLAEAAAAYEALDRREVVGRAIVTMA